MAGSLPSTSVSRRGFLGGASLLGGAWVLSGCTLFEQEAGESADGDEGVEQRLRYAMRNVAALDPHFVNDGVYIGPMGLLEGLVTQSDDGSEAVPAGAESWELSEDLLTYTFTMRADATWSNGDPITAGDYETTYQRLLTPGRTGATSTGGANAYRPGLGIAGASSYLSGAVTDWADVGITAEDDARLVITLTTPNPDFLLGMTHYSMVALHQPTLEEFPQDWSLPENWVGNGPFVPVQWVVNSSMSLVANEQYWDAGNVGLTAVDIQFLDDAPQRLTLFRNQEVEISDASPRLAGDDQELLDRLVQIPNYSVAYLALMHSLNPALEDVRVREALSLAVDRAQFALIDEGAKPGVSLVPDNINGWDESLAVEYDVDRALSLLEDAGYAGGQGLPPVNLLSFAPDPKLAALAEMWKANLGIDVVLEIVERGVYSQKRGAVQEGDYIGYYFGTFAGLPTMNGWVGDIWGPDFILELSLPGQAWADYQAVQDNSALSATDRAAQHAEITDRQASAGAIRFGDMVERARTQGDPDATRTQLREAAMIREQTYLVLPLSWNALFMAAADRVENVHFRPSPEYFYFKGISLT